MISTKIKTKILNSKFIDLDSRFSFYDINLKRIAQYILKLEQTKYTKINLYSQHKINKFLEVKTKLNTIKKKNIDILRNDFKLNYNNPIISNIALLHKLTNTNKQHFKNKIITENKKDIICFMVVNKIISVGYLRAILEPYFLKSYDLLTTEKILLKMPKVDLIRKAVLYGDFDILLLKENYDLIKTIDKYKAMLNKSVSLEHDIKKIETLVYDFKKHVKSLEKYNPFIYKNQYSKINQFDLYMLDNGKTTHNLKQLSYFYLIKCKKINNSKNPTYRQNLTDKLFLGVVTEKDINQLIEFNFKETFKDIDIKIRNTTQTYINFILNKYF